MFTPILRNEIDALRRADLTPALRREATDDDSDPYLEDLVRELAAVYADHPDYREDLQNLQDHARRVLRNALEDFEESEPFVPGEGSDEDDERGMC